MSYPTKYTLHFKTSDGVVFTTHYTLLNGKSSYEVWLEQPGNSGLSETDYAVYLRGIQGDYVSSVSVHIDQTFQ